MLDLLDNFVAYASDIVEIANDALILSLVGGSGVLGWVEEGGGGRSKRPWNVVHASLGKKSQDMVGKVELHSTIGVACDVGACVFGGLVMPYELSVSFGEGGFEEGDDSTIGREDLSVVNMHHEGTFVGWISGICVVIHRGLEGEVGVEWVVAG